MGFESKLNGEYLDVYKSIMKEIEIEDINAFKVEEVRNDILDMFLSAQEDGIPAKAIIGNNSKAFIEDIVMNLEDSNSKLYRIAKLIPTIIVGIGGISLTRIENGSINVTIEIFILAMILIIGEMLGRGLSKKYKWGKSRRVRKNIIEWSFNLSFMILVIFIIDVSRVPVLFVINSPYIFIIGCFIIGLLSVATVDILFSNKKWKDEYKKLSQTSL